MHSFVQEFENIIPEKMKITREVKRNLAIFLMIS
jgi:hypothetical protein